METKESINKVMISPPKLGGVRGGLNNHQDNTSYISSRHNQQSQTLLRKTLRNHATAPEAILWLRLKNKQVADLRAYYPMFANNSSLIEVVSNATSMDAINKRIKEIPLKIDYTEDTRDFLRTKKEITEMQKIQKGFDLLTEDSEEGIYKLTHTTKS